MSWEVRALFGGDDGAVSEHAARHARSLVRSLADSRVEAEALVDLPAAGELYVVDATGALRSSSVPAVEAGRPRTLASLLSTCRPDHRVACLVWGHGTGWPGLGPTAYDDSPAAWESLRNLTPTPPPPSADPEQGMLLPDRGKDGIDSARLRAAFQLPGGRRIDLLALSACHMASIEVLEILGELAVVVLASPDRIPAAAGGHLGLAPHLEHDRSEEQVASGLVDAFAREAVTQGWETSLYAWDTVQVRAAAAILDQLGEALRVSPATATAVRAIRDETSARYGHPDWACYDLGAVLAGLEAACPDLRRITHRLRVAAHGARIAGWAHDRSPRSTLGMSVFLPRPGAGWHPKDYPGDGGWAGWCRRLSEYDGAPDPEA